MGRTEEEGKKGRSGGNNSGSGSRRKSVEVDH